MIIIVGKIILFKLELKTMVMKALRVMIGQS